MSDRVASSSQLVFEEWKWDLLEGVETFLHERVTGGPRHAVEYRFTDDHGGMNITSIADAKRRSDAEGTTPAALRLTISFGDVGDYLGRSEAQLDVTRLGDEVVVFSVSFSGKDDRWTRSLKVDFDAWYKRWDAAHQPPPEPEPQRVIIELPEPEPPPPWWRPDLRSIRDNLLANAIWLLLATVVVAVAGAIALSR